MKSAVQTLTALLADIEGELPKYLTAHGAGQLESYSIGYPVDREKKTQLCVRFAEAENDWDTFVFDIHVNLPGVTELDSYRYLDAVKEYLSEEFNPQIAGFSGGYYATAMSDNFKTTVISQYWSVTLTYSSDDCD